MIKYSVTAVLVAVFLFSGCYHAEIVTGKEPSNRVIDKPWAMSFIGGLVPPPLEDVSAQCGDAGVAIVETQHSFLNMLAAAITFSLFTPMHITVTCAEGGSMSTSDVLDMEVSRTASVKEKEAAIQVAVLQSADRGTPVRVSFVE